MLYSGYFLYAKVGSAKALETPKTRDLCEAGTLLGEVGSISMWRKTLAKKKKKTHKTMHSP